MEATLEDVNSNLKFYNDTPKKLHDIQDTTMTSSTASSLSSPMDSGIQLLDSESEINSLMSGSGYGDIDGLLGCEKDMNGKNGTVVVDICKIDNKNILLIENGDNKVEDPCMSEVEEVGKKIAEPNEQEEKSDSEKPVQEDTITTPKQNISESNRLSKSVPSYFDKFEPKPSNAIRTTKLETQSFSDDVFEMEHPIKNAEVDLMNVSLTSYELLDYTLQNKKIDAENPDMHVSLSEEVNENLKVILNGTPEKARPEPVTENVPITENKEKQDDQIVFRRQRKKKSKSDTPKKRVSFHEDILNSTKIDDIHINHGFITHEDDVAFSFYQRGFIRKSDVVKGRYSWAAEGDAPYYEKAGPQRETKSDIYVNPRYSSTSSSSSASVSSSIDEEDSEENYDRKEPDLKSKPKSSCLKKTKCHRKYIDTNIVEEETNLKKKKSETNLLDSNIFGSLKNILNFSSSVPLAERGVPEGQEDITIYSSSHDATVTNKRKTFGSLQLKNFEVKPVPVSKIDQAKSNMKLTRSEGFYPTYPNVQENLPSNIIICDSNVYEHKGISYSYEYDNFQKTFEQENKPKSSTLYQTILKEFNFFRRKARDDSAGCADLGVVNNDAATPDTVVEEKPEKVEEAKSAPKTPLSKISSSKMDWSDTDTQLSELSEAYNTRHLSSPKRRVNKSNHYSVSQSFKVPLSDRSDDNDVAKSLTQLRPTSSSGSSLINRFLKNVTAKKLMDVKSRNKTRSSSNILGLFVKGVRPPAGSDELDGQLEEEIVTGRETLKAQKVCYDKKMIAQFRKELFRNRLEKVVGVFYVRSSYTTNGDTRPLLTVLTDMTVYISGTRPNGTYCNHFVLPYTELNTILIGPNGQTIHLSNYDKDMQCIITTGCSNMTRELVGRLEIAMRRDGNRPRLPAVKQLSMADMANLRRSVCKQTSVDKNEEYFYYSIVNVQDLASEGDSTPLGPNKEGPLMFKTSESEASRWETAYFILKAGVLYMLSSVSQRVPMRVFPLINGSCQGARRVFNSVRPHTFQLIVEGKSLLLAAPDEYVASEWLQELIHAASGAYTNREKHPTQACTLLMTSEHILTVREAFSFTVTSLLPPRSKHDPIKGAQALSCACIVDLTSFRLPSAEQSWCILEFACREVHEYSGDWILYFSTNAELENFISTLEMLWHYNNENGDSFPLSTIPETDPLSKKCVDFYTSLIGVWPANTVLLQFL
ncbi:unnamed protein product [Acanthoscelides obtectus]|uniref:PH domain-containing protein n=1 Tax=Acanthoscelides obtectus TaxID=200917 RepID=A0A9P0KS02_ACAOB|nr:unnamed protein product [Acanthoscelides obtectus]CAK1641755.1 Pleckstrin homology domain-containing family M member 2 [Acanthoscelides obtectus]